MNLGADALAETRGVVEGGLDGDVVHVGGEDSRRYQLRRSESSLVRMLRRTVPSSPSRMIISSGATSLMLSDTLLCEGALGSVTAGPRCTCGTAGGTRAR